MEPKQKQIALGLSLACLAAGLLALTSAAQAAGVYPPGYTPKTDAKAGQASGSGGSPSIEPRENIQPRQDVQPRETVQGSQPIQPRDPVQPR